MRTRTLTFNGPLGSRKKNAAVESVTPPNRLTEMPVVGQKVSGYMKEHMITSAANVPANKIRDTTPCQLFIVDVAHFLLNRCFSFPSSFLSIPQTIINAIAQHKKITKQAHQK